MNKQIVIGYASIGDLERLNKLGYSFEVEGGQITKVYDREGVEI